MHLYIAVHMSGDPTYLKCLKGELPIQKIAFLQNYKKTYLDTGRFAPVVHVITGIVIIGYTIEFFSHLRYERHAAKAKHAAAHH